MKHKIAVILIALTLAFVFTGVTAFAEETYSEGYFYYTEGEGCVIITGYFGKDAVAYLPDHIAGLPVSEIAKGAFVDTTLSEIHLPFTVMTIQEGAFGENITVYYDDGRIEESESPETDNDNTAGDSGDINSGSTENDKGESEKDVNGEDESGKSSNDKSNKSKKAKDKKSDNRSTEEKHEVLLVEAQDGATLATETDEEKADAFNELMDERAEEAAKAEADAEKGVGTGVVILIVCICTFAAAVITYIILNNKNKKGDEKQ